MVVGKDPGRGWNVVPPRLRRADERAVADVRLVGVQPDRYAPDRDLDRTEAIIREPMPGRPEPTPSRIAAPRTTTTHHQDTGALVRAGRERAVVAADHLRGGRARVTGVPRDDRGGPGERAEVRCRLRPSPGELRGGQQPEQGRDDQRDRHEREQQDGAGPFVRSLPIRRGRRTVVRRRPSRLLLATAVARARSGEPPHDPDRGRDLDGDPLAGAGHRHRGVATGQPPRRRGDVAVRLAERCRPGPRPRGVGAARLRDRRRRDRQQRDQQQDDRGQTDRELGRDAATVAPPAPITATAPGG